MRGETKMDLPKKFYAREESIYKDNFTNVVSEGFHLTMKGFDTVSEISSYSYQNAFKTSWLDIVIYFGYESKLYDYVIDEFNKFMLKTKSKGLKRFFEEHEYLKGRLYETLDKDRVTDSCGIKRCIRNHSEEELENNFINVIEAVGNIPIYTEFLEHTSIVMLAYKKQLNFPNVKYINLINYYCSEDEKVIYEKRRLESKRNAGKSTGHLSRKYDDDALLFEFIRVFELCHEIYGDYPSTNLFNKISNIDESVYRGRFNLRWSEICLMYGYEIDYINNAEKMCLNLISKITNIAYQPQKTFEWLRGIKEFPLFCDGYYHDLGLVVEFDGRQHREPVADFGGEKRFKITIANDEIKNNEIPKHGLKFIRISSEDPWYDEEFLKNKLIENNIQISA